MNNQMKEYIGLSPKGSWAQELLSLWGWGVSPSYLVEMFASLEVLQVLSFNGDFIS